jgi:uncharacterized phage-like protein YoqJ
MIEEVVAVTAHRPQHLSLADGYWVQGEFDRIMTKLEPRTAVSGMALGGDTWWATTALEHEVPLHAYIPFDGQEKRWSKDDQIYYKDLLRRAEKVIYVCMSYHKGAFQMRNRAMVDASGVIVAAWNGKTHGGTWNCLQYAEKANKPIVMVDIPLRRTFLRRAV